MKKSLEIAAILERVVQLIVDSPKAVTVEVSAGGTLKLNVAPHDVGRLIGMNGRTAQALQVLTNALSSTTLMLRLDIVEDGTT